MSLHGLIQVNGAAIGDYVIRRLDELTSEDAEHDYEWAVTFPARRDWQHQQGRVLHRYSDGAGVLLAKVLMAAEGGSVAMPCKTRCGRSDCTDHGCGEAA